MQTWRAFEVFQSKLFLHVAETLAASRVFFFLYYDFYTLRLQKMLIMYWLENDIHIEANIKNIEEKKTPAEDIHFSYSSDSFSHRQILDERMLCILYVINDEMACTSAYSYRS